MHIILPSYIMTRTNSSWWKPNGQYILKIKFVCFLVQGTEESQALVAVVSMFGKCMTFLDFLLVLLSSIFKDFLFHVVCVFGGEGLPVLTCVSLSVCPYVCLSKLAYTKTA